MAREQICSASELQARSRAQEIVKGIATQIGGQLSQWRNSIAPEWEYAKLTIGDAGFTIGASTGGAVSVNGDPFTIGERKLSITPETMLESIRSRVNLALQAPYLH